MKKLRDYSKPLMVIENFSANQYVAFCAESSQYLYLDAIKATTFLGITSYSAGSDNTFQDANHASGLAEFLRWLLSLVTGQSYDTDGEYLKIRTTSNPTQKGELSDFANSNYPIYGSESQLSNGVYYNGVDLRNLIKKTPDNQYYIQGNMS